MRQLPVLSSLFLILAFFASANARGQGLPAVPYGGSWRYIDTEHFKVIYHRGGEPLARRSAAIAEIVHRRLSKMLSWRPSQRTRIIVLDNTDQANAMALAFPRNTILVHPAPPAGEPGNYLDWLYELLLHEYAHILQIDMATGFMAGLRSVFGRIVLPNALQPMSQLEGLAVYAESRFSSMGRNNGALSGGILRTSAAEGSWPTIDRAGAFNSRWPWDAPYIFGGKFTRYLADSFGESSLARYNLDHAGLCLPFLQNRPAKRVYGKALPALWDDWSRSAGEACRAQADSLEGRGIPQMEPVTGDGLYKSSLALSPDGSLLAYYANDGRSHPGLTVLETKSGSLRLVHRGYIDGAMAFSPDGKSVYFGQVDLHDDGREVSCDLYRLDLGTGKADRLSRGWRARDPAPSPDGRLLYFATTRLGQGALCRLDLSGGMVDTLVGLSDSSHISCPSVSPDGRRLAFSAWTGEGHQDIHVLALDDGQCRPITRDRAQDLQPRWSDDGSSLFFSSDRSGVWNLYRWDLGSGEIYQATNQVGGAFWPCPGRGALWGLSLGGRGYDVARTGPERPTVPADAAAPDRFFVTGPVDPFAGSSKPYAFWKSLMPVAWLPAGFADSGRWHPGAAVVGADDLMRHYYLASLAPDRDFRRWHYDAQYMCSQLPAGVYARFGDYVVPKSSRDVPGYYERRRERLLDLTKTSASYRRSFSLGLGYRKLTLGREAGPEAGYWTGTLADVAASASYRDAKRYLKSISPEGGRAATLSARVYRRALGGDADQTWGQAEWREFLTLPAGNLVLMLAAKAGSGRSAGIFVDEFADGYRARGFQDGPGGPKKTRAIAEFRFPLARVERGRGTWPIFLHVLHGAMFIDAGWGGRAFGSLAWEGTQRSLGAELRSDWTVLYGIGLQAGAGVAAPLGGKGDVVPYLSVTTSLDAFHGKKVH